MDVSAQTLREVEFREKLRGYHPDDVDEFLERVAAGIEFLQQKLVQANARAARAEQKAAESHEDDDALRRTLVLAQRTAELAVQEARDEAARLTSAAQAKAQSAVADAEEFARRAVDELQGGLRADITALESARDQLRADIADLERYIEQERLRLRDGLTQLVRRIEDDFPSTSAAPDERDVDVPAAPVISAPPLQWDAPIAEQAPALEAVPEVEIAAEGQLPSPRDDAPRVDWSIELEDEPVAGAGDMPEAEAEIDSVATGPEPEPAAPEPTADVREPVPVAATSAEYEDDPFIAELRRAITDTEPLGPRDDEPVPDDTGNAGFYDGDDSDARRFGSLLRRRR